MTVAYQFTSADLVSFPDIPGVRYEIIDGDLYVSRQPHVNHQIAADRIQSALHAWSDRTKAGVAVTVPGLAFAEDNDVIPDVVWTSSSRFAEALDDVGHFRAAPELIVEVISPGPANELRDRKLKLNLYSRQGVHEYWIVDWQRHTVDVCRSDGQQLTAVATFRDGDTLSSPVLPGFHCSVAELWGPPSS